MKDPNGPEDQSGGEPATLMLLIEELNAQIRIGLSELIIQSNAPEIVKECLRGRQELL